MKFDRNYFEMCQDKYGFKLFSEYCGAIKLIHSRNSISVVQMILELYMFILKAHVDSWAKHNHFRPMFIPLSTLILTQGTLEQSNKVCL